MAWLHTARSHAALREALLAGAQARFADPPDDGVPWRPLDGFDDDRRDAGAGLFDAVALALRVLWVYQEAWADESFLGTAHLDSSVRRLLRHIDYQPSPGLAAVGFQPFTCRAGLQAQLPAGTAVRAKALGTEVPEVTYETLHSIRLDPVLNELQLYLPPSQSAPGGGLLGEGGELGFGDEAPSGVPGQPGPPVPDSSLFQPTDVTDGLLARLIAARGGPIADRRLAYARRRAIQLMELMQELERFGAAESCKEELRKACEALVAAQADAAKTAGRRAGPLSETQAMVGRLLRQLRSRGDTAHAALEAALAPCPANPPDCPGESPTEYAARLDAMLAFLDGFVSALVQEARDNVVLLHGSDALARLDAYYGIRGRRAHAMGIAEPGTNLLYVVEAENERLSGRLFPELRPGDWVTLADIDEQVALDGKVTRTRTFKEVVRVVEVRSVVPPGRSTRQTRIKVDPPLRFRYALHRTVLVGNLARISAGKRVAEPAEVAIDGRTVALRRAPLTWIPDPTAPHGRRADLEVTVDGRRWTEVPTLLGAGPESPVYVVRADPNGGTRVRFGNGHEGARPRRNAAIRLSYRVGLGEAGNRGAGQIAEMVSANAAVATTLNPLALGSGAEPEAREQARVRGPLALRALDRAVSVEDVRAVALAVDGIERVAVFRDAVRRRGELAVVVAGSEGRALSKVELEALRRHLQARVAPGVVIRLENRQEIAVRASLRLFLPETADPVEVSRVVRIRLGVDRDADEPPGLLDPRVVQLGVPIHLSALYGALSGIDELASVVVRGFHRGGRPQLSDRIDVRPRELPFWAEEGLTIETRAARDLP